MRFKLSWQNELDVPSLLIYLLFGLIGAIFFFTVGLTTTDSMIRSLALFFGIICIGSLLIIELVGFVGIWTRKKAYEKARRLRAQFEAEQKAKGLVSFVNQFGREKWGTPEQVFEWRQLEKGLVEYEGEWVTPQERNEREKMKREKEIKRRRRKREKFEKLQMEKGLVKFVDRLGRERWGTPEQVKKWNVVDMDMRNHFAMLKPRQFERLVGDLFEKMGYVVALTPKTADYGADVIVKKGKDIIVIQVKRYAPTHNVSNRDVQRLLGSMWKYGANRAIFVTSSDYTNFAYRQARGAPIELWNYRTLCDLIEKHILNF